MPMTTDLAPAIEIRGLTFSYPGARAPVFDDLSLAVPRAARCLLLGANGVGKSTLLRLVAGRHMIAPHLVSVLGRPAFHDTNLAGEVAFLGGPFPFSADIRVGDVALNGVKVWILRFYLVKHRLAPTGDDDLIAKF